jgi:hypothetical protein
VEKKSICFLSEHLSQKRELAADIALGIDGVNDERETIHNYAGVLYHDSLSFRLPVIGRLVQVRQFQFVMVALVEGDVAVDHAPLRRSRQHHIRFDGAGRVDDHAGADAAVVPHTAAQHRAVGDAQLPVAIPRADGGGMRL